MNEADVTAKYLPVTLESRGVAVPFTTFSIAYARVRRGKKGAEIIIPGFTGQLLAHIIPLSEIGDVVGLSIFDRVFCEKITDIVENTEIKITPHLIRNITLEIGETGLGGVEMMRQCRARKLLSENLEFATLNQLTNQLITENTKEASNLNIADPSHEHQATGLLEGYGLSLGLNGAEVITRLKKISSIMSEYKGPNKGMNGPVYDILSRMERLIPDLRHWLISEPIEEAEMAQRTSMLVESFLKYAAPYRDTLDEVFENIDRTLSRWETMETKLPDHLNKLDFMLDGWLRILDARDKADKAQRFIQRETLSGFAPFSPVLSKDIIQPDDMNNWLEHRRAQLRWAARVSLIRDLRPDGLAALQSAKVGVL